MPKTKASGLGVTHLNRPTATSDNMCYVAFDLGSCIAGGIPASLATLSLPSDGQLGLPWPGLPHGL